MDLEGNFCIRLHTKKGDCRRVILHYQDKYIPLDVEDTRHSLTMEKFASDAVTDYYEGTVSMDVICLRYYFELESEDGCVYYGNYRFFSEKIEGIDYMFDCPKQSRMEQAFLVPDWARGSVVYQIFPDRFSPADDDAVSDEIWYRTPVTAKDRLGGCIKGITRRLDYLEELGVETLYLTPVFLSPSNHKYDTVDYYQISPEFGTKEDLKELVQKAHGRGMHVLLDGVFNHTSTEFFAFADLMEKGADSAYADWYYPTGFPLEARPMQKPNYLSFGYHGGMPKLNCNNPEVQDYIIKVALYWMQECGTDGWRLDVGDEISHAFWKRFRREIRAVNPDALIVGEIWFYAPAFLQGDEWDSVMNYQFRDGVAEFAARGAMTASQFAAHLEFMHGNVHAAAYDVLWNLIDCHDTERFLHIAGENKARLRLAAAVQILTHGSPMLYYGDEAGLSGGNDPDCRRGMLWDGKRRDDGLFSYYRRLTALRRTYRCIRYGRDTVLSADDESGVIVIRRYTKEEEVLLVFHGKDGVASVPQYAGRRDLLMEKTFAGTLGAFETAVLWREP